MITLYDRFGVEYEAEKVPPSDIPSFQEGFGRYWESYTKYIDGLPVDFFVDVSRGRYFYFIWNGDWYRIDGYDFYDTPSVDRFYTHPPLQDMEPGSAPLPNSVDASTIIDYCRQAKEKLVRLHITYVKRDGTVEDYYVEPYSLREENGNVFLYAYPMHADHIEKYYLNRIINVELTNSPFSPRWEIEFRKEKRNVSGNTLWSVVEIPYSYPFRFNNSVSNWIFSNSASC